MSGQPSFVIVSHRQTHALHAIGDTSAVSNVRESAVAVIAVKNIPEFTGSNRLHCLRVADEIDIQEAITVVVNEAAAATHSLD